MSEEEEEVPETVEEIRIVKEVIKNADSDDEHEKIYKLSPEFYEDNDITDSTKELIKKEIDDLFKMPENKSNTETVTNIKKNENGEIITTTTTTTKTEIGPVVEVAEKKIIEDDNNNFDSDNEIEPEKKIKISEGPNSEIVKETVIKKNNDNGDVIEITKETIKKVKDIEESNNEKQDLNENRKNLRKNKIADRKVETIKSSNEPVFEKNERKKIYVETNNKNNDNDIIKMEKPKQQVASSRIMKSKRLQYKLKNKKIEEKSE